MKKTALAISVILIALVETGCYTTDDIAQPYAQSMDTQQRYTASNTSSGGGNYSQTTTSSSGSHRTWVNGHYDGGTWVRGHFEG